MISFGERGFNGLSWWGRNRERLVWQNEDLLRSHQEKSLIILKNWFGTTPDFISQIPPLIHSRNAISLTTAGTMTGIRRDYLYPRPQYEAIEAHHWWRIESSHHFTDPGIIVEFFYNSRYMKSDGGYVETNPLTDETRRAFGSAPEDKLFGPDRRLAFGVHNEVYHVTYNRFTSAVSWRYNLERAASLYPKAVVMSPSQFQAAWFHTGGFRFECPVVMTREVLDEPIRQLAKQAFTAVIDKMRCWDGGLGFFECPAGRKHIYDELAIVREDEGRLISTDLYNFCHPFINYWNGDMGKLSQGSCDCGVWGNYLVEMNGRVNDAILIGGVIFPGSIVVSDVCSFFRYGCFPSGTFHRAFYGRFPEGIIQDINCLWSVRQKKDQSVEFRYWTDPLLTDQQVEAMNVAIPFLVGRDPGNLDASKFDRMGGKVPVTIIMDDAVHDRKDDRCKMLSVTSEALR